MGLIKEITPLLKKDMQQSRKLKNRINKQRFSWQIRTEQLKPHQILIICVPEGYDNSCQTSSTRGVAPGRLKMVITRIWWVIKACRKKKMQRRLFDLLYWAYHKTLSVQTYAYMHLRALTSLSVNMFNKTLASTQIL